MGQMKFLIVLLIVFVVDYNSARKIPVHEAPRNGEGNVQEHEPRRENYGEGPANQGDNLRVPDHVMRGNHPEHNFGGQEAPRNQRIRDEFDPEDDRFIFDGVLNEPVENFENLIADARVDQILSDIMMYHLNAIRRAGNARNRIEGRPINFAFEVEALPTTYREFLQGSLVHPNIKVELVKGSNVLINPQILSEIITTNRNSPQEIQRKLLDALVTREQFLSHKSGIAPIPEQILDAVQGFLTSRIKNPPSHGAFIEVLNNQVNALRARWP